MTSLEEPTALSESSAEPRWHGRVAVLLLIVLTLVAMGQIAGHDFSWWDDPMTLHHNPRLHPPTLAAVIHYWMHSEAGLYIPVTYTVWAMVAFVAQVPADADGIALNPWLFHATSLFVHVAAVLLAYRIIRLLNLPIFAAFCGALLFGVHPIQVEAVAWASGLKDVLSGCLALLALSLYVLYARSDQAGRSSIRQYVLATIAFVLALLAKPSAMALPLTAAAIDHWCVGRSWRKVLPGVIGWIIVAIPIAVVARLVQEADTTPMPALWLRPLIVCDSLAFYMGKLVWPVHLIVDYGRNPPTVFAHGWCYWDWIFPVGAALFLAAGARRRPMLLAAGIAFVAGCLPVLGFTPAIFEYFSTTTDHYLYLAMFGPALAMAWLLSGKPTIVAKLATLGVMATLIALTIRQTSYWRDDVTLFSHDAAVNPASYVGYINLGADHERNHDLPHAIDDFRRATLIHPDYPLAWGDLGDALNQAGHTDEAIDATRKAVEGQAHRLSLKPNWPQDNELLGELLCDKGRYAEAIPFMETALALEPKNGFLARELVDARKHAATQPARP